MKKLVLVTVIIALALTTVIAKGSSEEAFPTRKVTIIMPWGLGGGPDTIARKVASYGEKYLGVPVIVENKIGGAGTIAMDALLQAKDDGYTMVVANGPLFSLTPAFIDVNYTIEDITPLIGMRVVEFVILSNPKYSNIHTLEELIALGRSGKNIKYATTGGPGNDSYTMISVLFKKLNISAQAVPYEGGQDAINALLGGHVDIAIGSPPVYREYVKSGEFACLGTFIPEGITVEGIGRIPSFKQQGIAAEFVGMDYFAVLSSVDAEKKAILTKFIQDVYADPTFIEYMASLGMEAWSATEAEILKEITLQTAAMEEYIDLLT